MIQPQTIRVLAGASNSEPLPLPPGARVVRIRTPTMAVATSFSLSGGIADGTYDTLFQGSSNTALSFTVGATVRSINIPPDYTAGLSSVQIKLGGIEAADKDFIVVYEW